MGKETYRVTKGTCEQSEELGPNSFPKTCMKVELKKENWPRKTNKGGKQWNRK
jgi:hypothetical protein